MVVPFCPMATYTQRTCLRWSPDSQFCRWLRMVSTHTAVLPVLRSPMISWRWPRPMGVMASMALIPVCSGSFTPWRFTTDGAWIFSARRVAVSMSPRPPRGGAGERIADAPKKSFAHGYRQPLAGALDLLAFFDFLEIAQDHRADAVLVEVERDAEHPARKLEQLLGHDGR